MCRTFEVNSSKPQISLPQSQLPGKGNLASQPPHQPFLLPVFYMGGQGFGSMMMPTQGREETINEQNSMSCSTSGNRPVTVQTPSVVASMTPSEFPFPAVNSMKGSQNGLEVVTLVGRHKLNLPNSMGKFMLVPCDDNANFLQPTVEIEKSKTEHTMFQSSHATNSSTLKHRASCHRCGNLRKKNTLCSRCPHTFCHRCADKMQEEHGAAIFDGGCPVCKDLCCCGKNRSIHCNRKYHCYKKCPCTKRQRPQNDRSPSQVVLGPNNNSFYPQMMNMMTPSMNGLNNAFFSQPMYEVPSNDYAYLGDNLKPCSEPEWPTPTDPPKPESPYDVLGKHGMTSGEDSASTSELEDCTSDESPSSKRYRTDNSGDSASSVNASLDEEDALSALLSDEHFEWSLQEFDNALGKDDVELLNLSDDQLFDLLALDSFDF